VIEAQRASILVPHDHRHISQMSASAECECDGLKAGGRGCWLLWTKAQAVTATVPSPFQLCTAEPREGPGRCRSPSTSVANGFAIRRAGGGGTAYDWLSGPNQGHGFGSSGTPNRSVREHRGSIRAFLAMIDPNSGYIGDD
jgi:hypothetical protein